MKRPHTSVLIVVMLFATQPLMSYADTGDDSTKTAANNTLTMDAQIVTRGEIRKGGLPENDFDEDLAAFFMERTRLSLTYSRPYLDVKIAPQHSGVWGQSGKGSLNLYETWFQLKARNGLFTRIGRQQLSYDNERIIGPDDWAMAASSHDVLKAGYEGHGHKAHGIFAFNQNAENTNGGTYYKNGAQPYKTMGILWYHYDVPKTDLGFSIIFMNIGMQGDLSEENINKNEYQQFLGGYVLYTPAQWLIEGSYYRQFGNNEGGIPIRSWMASGKVEYTPIQKLKLTAGYDYMSGDEYYYVREKDQAGLIRHSKIKGFSTIYGSHHQFYGAMDFFYISTYRDGFTPGLQNIYFGATTSPIKKLHINTSYHYYATTTKLKKWEKTLGHALEVTAAYQFMPDASISAGYSFMKGSDTMEALKCSSEDKRLQWAWITVAVSPRIFKTKW